MIWSKSFREAYLERPQRGSGSFENDILWRGLHRRALPLAWLVRIILPNFFEMELRTISYLGNSRSSGEFRAELDTYRSEYRRHGGFLRNALGVRLSGRRLMGLLMEVAPESKRSIEQSL
jgi:hypothetical protein